MDVRLPPLSSHQLTNPRSPVPVMLFFRPAIYFILLSRRFSPLLEVRAPPSVGGEIASQAMTRMQISHTACTSQIKYRPVHDHPLYLLGWCCSIAGVKIQVLDL